MSSSYQFFDFLMLDNLSQDSNISNPPSKIQNSAHFSWQDKKYFESVIVNIFWLAVYQKGFKFLAGLQSLAILVNFI